MIDFSTAEEKSIVEACREQDRKAQRWLYERYAPIFLGVCRRYFKSSDQAEDAMIKAFYKILTEIDKYSGTGSFAGWMRRIVVNECLMTLRKKKLEFADMEVVGLTLKTRPEIDDILARDDLLYYLDRLPSGYRTVFNLYVIEGYTHAEIADELSFSINTSKTQLKKARLKLQELIGESVLTK